jgi:type VI secretion system protein ImpL
MSTLKRWLLHPLFLAILGGLLLSALVWWGLPLIRWNGEHPMDSLGWRLGGLAVVWLLIGLTVGLSWLRRRRAHAALLKSMGDSGPSAAAKEEAELQQRFSEAVALLKKTPGAKGASRADALYEMPWYVFIGAPGSGKTTALLNAGLNFPLTEKLGQASVRGVGGTRNCDWWFSDEAVLIDTAGRYATQDSDKDTDAAAWDTFLGLLKSARPRQPINGVLLTVSVTDLLTATPEERKTQAAKLRGRMQELRQRLGVSAPVYVLVTKADLIAGFNESFNTLGKEQRDQVFGFSFPLTTSQGGDVIAEFMGEYAALEKRLRERLIERMEAESDPLKRATVFAFPQQFAGLRGLLGAWLEAVFGGAGSLDERPLLRGVYFTSGTQEGTPIDRVLGTLARTFGVERKLAASPAGRGKSFFLNRLLKEVVFGESGLVGANAQVEKRQALLRRLGFVGLGLASVVLLAGWGVSYFANQRYIADIEAKLPDLVHAVDALPPASGSDLTGVPTVLAQVRDAAQPPGFTLDAPPMKLGFGLFQGDKLNAGAQISYQRLLERSLAPRIARRLEERLRAANRDNLEYAYEALKAYLMLYQPEHLEPNGFKDWIEVDWDANLANSLGAEQLAVLKAHLDALVANGGAIQVAQPMDKPLVANVREMLGAYPLEYRIFSRLRRVQLGRDLPEFNVAAAGGPQSPNVFVRASGQPLTRGVPGMFTRDGYKQAFEASMTKTAKQLAEEETWVLGSTAGRKGAADAQLPQRVRQLYLQEYVKVWDAYLADVKLIKFTSLEQSVNVARLLSAVDSPLAAYLRAASRETTLIEPAGEASRLDAVTGSLEQRAKQAANRQSELAAMVGNQPRPTAGSAQADGPIERIVDDHFAELRRMVSGQPAPIDDVLKLFGQVYVQLSAVDAAAKSKTAPAGGGGGGAALKAAAGQQPEPVRSMLEALASASDNQSRQVERQSLTDEIKPIAEFCGRAIAGRYPVAAGSKADIQPDDFGQLFAPGGQLDEFFQRKLSSLVDVGTNPWSFKPTGDGGRPVAPAALADFQRAARIRETFFRGGGRQPAFQVDLRVLEMEGLKELSLDFDGQVTKLAPNGPPVTLSWPGARPTAVLKLATQPAGTPLSFEGPWALFRLFDRFEIQANAQQPERFTVLMNLDGHRARIEVAARSVFNPLRLRELQQFRCPGAL